MRTAFFFAILASAAGAPRDGHPTGAGHRIHHIRRERANERRRRLEQREHVAKARADPVPLSHRRARGARPPRSTPSCFPYRRPRGLTGGTHRVQVQDYLASPEAAAQHTKLLDEVKKMNVSERIAAALVKVTAEDFRLPPPWEPDQTPSPRQLLPAPPAR